MSQASLLPRLAETPLCPQAGLCPDMQKRSLLAAELAGKINTGRGRQGPRGLGGGRSQVFMVSAARFHSVWWLTAAHPPHPASPAWDVTRSIIHTASPLSSGTAHSLGDA